MAVKLMPNCLRPWAGVVAALVITGLAAAALTATGALCEEGAGTGGDERCGQKHATLLVTLLMALLWVAGKPHSAVVALLPVVVLPWLGVGGTAFALENQYFNKVNFVLFGSFLLAIAIEEVGLHRRIALGVLSRVSGNPKVVLIAFMGISALLSAFMSNTATAALMCPLAASLFAELQGAEGGGRGACGGDQAAPSEMSATETSSTPSGDLEAPCSGDDSALRKYFAKLLLGIAYACTTGGVSTKTGTGTNLAFAQVYSQLTGETIPYGQWVMLGLPFAVLMLCTSWLVLTFMFGGLGLPHGYHIPTATLRQRYAEMGSISRSEVIVMAIGFATVVGWMFRDPGYCPGIAQLFQDPKAVTDATIVMTTTLPLFFIPKHPRAEDEAAGATILQWSKIAHKLPLGLFLLIGAGSAISHAFEVSGLSMAMGDALLGSVQRLPVFAVVMACSVLAATMSQATSDVAVANILLPIAYGLAGSLKLDPMVTMLPVALACSLPFMLVVSTPPNAIAFQSGFVEQSDMLKSGLVLTLSGLALIPSVCFLFGFKLLGVTDLVMG